MSIDTNNAIEFSMGNAGFRLVTNTASTTGPFVAITTVVPTIFTSITGNNISGTWGATTIPAGITMPGPIASFQLTSGSVIAYNGIINS